MAFRLLPVVGVTRLANPAEPSSSSSQMIIFGAGIATTAAFAFLVTLAVAGWEWRVGSRCVWGRMIVADAIVLTVFNFLPVPPLDGGRALLAVATAWRGAPLSADALFWAQISGLALAVLPLAIWTGWTRRIDALVMWWGAPARLEPGKGVNTRATAVSELNPSRR